MTALPDFDGFAAAKTASEAHAAQTTFAIDEVYWGYVVRCTEQEPMRVKIAQSMAWFSGICFAIATLGLWAVPMTQFQDDVLAMKLGATIILAGISVYMLWFASRGTHSELQIDTSLGEVREVVRNQAGRPSLIGCYGFDSFGGVHIDRTVLRQGHACLVIRYGNSGQFLQVAWAPEHQLLALRDRLGRDLMVRPRKPLPQQAGSVLG